MMPLSRKILVAAMLCLSIAMIVCALIRLAGTVTDTRSDGNGTAPVWSVYWGMVEGCVAVIMTCVITIRGVFITQDTEKRGVGQRSPLYNFLKRMLASLRLSSEKPTSSQDDLRNKGNNVRAPRIPTQGLTRATIKDVRRFFSSTHDRTESQEDVLHSVNTEYSLEDIDYHTIQRQQASGAGGKKREGVLN